MKEVNDLLYQQLQESDKQKLEFESKLIKLQAAFNNQLEEEKREITRLYQNRKSKGNRESNLALKEEEDTKNILSALDEGKNEDIGKIQNRMSLLHNENKSLKEVVKDLKKEIIELKNNNALANKGYNLIGTSVNVHSAGDQNSEKIIEDLMIE